MLIGVGSGVIIAVNINTPTKTSLHLLLKLSESKSPSFTRETRINGKLKNNPEATPPKKTKYTKSLRVNKGSAPLFSASQTTTLKLKGTIR